MSDFLVEKNFIQYLKFPRPILGTIGACETATRRLKSDDRDN